MLSVDRSRCRGGERRSERGGESPLTRKALMRRRSTLRGQVTFRGRAGTCGESVKGCVSSPKALRQASASSEQGGGSLSTRKHRTARRSVVGDSSRRGFPQEDAKYLRRTCARRRFVAQGAEVGERIVRTRRTKSGVAENTDERRSTLCSQVTFRDRAGTCGELAKGCVSSPKALRQASASPPATIDLLLEARQL